MELITVHHDLVIPNRWNPNRVDAFNQMKLETSIERLGLFKPVIVRELEDGMFEILGGEHRYHYLRERNMEVPILNLGRVGDDKAKEIGLVDNTNYGDDDPTALKELLESIEISEHELLSFIPMKDEDLTALFKDDDFDMESLGGVDDEHEADDDGMRTIIVKVGKNDVRAIVDKLEEIALENDDLSEDKALRFGNAIISLLGSKT
jgi:ParB-like chromosome segregation protein Spo0J